MGEITVDWDVALKIWAVIGPLIAASASAVWARRIQIQDRQYDRKQQELARSQSLEDRHLEFQRSTLHSHKSELRAAIAQFVSATNEFLMACGDNRSESRSAETQRREIEASGKMNAHYQNVILLGTDEIAKCATQLLNLAVDYPTQVAHEPEDKRKEHTTQYQIAKRALTKAARKLLGLRDEA
jgi:hypothetical protein